MITTAERNAFAKAIRLNLAAQVVKTSPCGYTVPSTTTNDVYALWQDSAGQVHCGCTAGVNGRPCVHAAALVLRKTQENAKRQAYRLTRAPQPARKEVALT